MSTTGANILATLETVGTLLENDLIAAAGTPILSFLNNVKANPTPFNEAAQWLALHGQLIGALPGLEVTVQQQLLTFIINKVQALMQKAQSQAATPAAA